MGTIDDMGIKPNLRPEVRIRMGRKGTSGGVSGKDRFWLAYARASGSGMKAVSELHPSFAAFNVDREALALAQARAAKRRDNIAAGQPPDRDLDRVSAPQVNNAPFRTLWGVLVHAAWEQSDRLQPGCVFTRYAAHKLPKVSQTPGSRPACTGDGRRAQRWDGKEFQPIPCPGDACEFRVDPGTRDGMPCKRSSTLVLQLRWPSGPCPTCKGRAPAVNDCDDCDRTGKVDRTFPSSTAMIESSGPWSYASHQWWGFYTQIVEQFQALGGVGEPNLYGLPIRLVLTRATVASRGSAIWIPEVFTDFPAHQTLQGWLMERHAMRHQLGDELHGQLQLAGPVMGAREVVEAAYDDIPDAPYELPDERGAK